MNLMLFGKIFGAGFATAGISALVVFSLQDWDTYKYENKNIYIYAYSEGDTSGLNSADLQITESEFLKCKLNENVKNCKITQATLDETKHISDINKFKTYKTAYSAITKTILQTQQQHMQN